jgi:hypothetical protein
MKRKELEAILNFYGYELQEINTHLGYKDRKKNSVWHIRP